MDLRKKFKNNIFFAFGAQTVSMLMSIMMSLFVPKLLNVTNFGYWQLFIFYYGYVGFFHFGLNDGVYLKYGGVEYNKTAVMIVSSIQFSPPDCAVSASPTLITTSNFFKRSLSALISSKLINDTSNGAPLTASIIPK